MIILLDAKEYAVGLNWFAISSQDEVAQFQSELDLDHGVLKLAKEKDEQSIVALCGPEYDGQISLAGMLSYAYTNLIYVAATEYKNDNGDALFYLCAIKNHAVTVEGDVVGTWEEIETLYNQNYAELTAEGDVDNLMLLGTNVDQAAFAGVTLVDAHQVLDPALRYTAQATIKVLGKAGLSKLSVGMIVVIFLLGSYFIYSFFLKSEPPPAPVAERPQPTRPTVPVIRDPYESFIARFQETIDAQPQLGVVVDVVTQIRDVPLSYGGWQVESIQFLGDNPSVLTLNLKRAPYTSVERIFERQDMGYFETLQVDTQGNTAIATIPLAATELPYMPMRLFKDLSQSTSPVYYRLIDILQRNDASGINFDTDDVTFNQFFAQANVKFSGNGLWQMVALYQLLKSIDTLGVTSVNVNVNQGNYNWTIEGMVYG